MAKTALLAGVGLLLTATLAACGNAKTTVSHAGNTEGVFSNRVVVGALSSQTGPLPADFAPVVTGAQVYLDMVNAQGGIDGRRIDLAYSLDDQSSPSINVTQARALVDEFHVFAVVAVATPVFTGASFLAANDVPTFGLNVNPQWSGPPSLFGNTGSYVNFTAPQVAPAFLAEQHHAHAVAVLAYNVAQSRAGCQGTINGLHRYGIPIAFEDLSIPAPASDLHADVTRMQAAGVDMIVSCMDLGGNVLLSQTMQEAGVSGVTQLWQDGYDESAIHEYTSAMQGVYFNNPHAPFEVTQLDPGVYPGVDQFQAMLKRYAPGTLPSEAALAGWTSADLFVTGMRAVGRDLTRSRLVAAINRISSFTADGTIAPIDWRLAHTSSPPPDCTAYVQAVGTKFVPVYGTPKSVFSCFQTPYPPTTAPITLVNPVPAGVPSG
ncbi:MAG TPA: ABC transporter substrate-binding protein [Acidimicrobiales bacterium]|nr:ABC transporter substrate-binding protein [Acidimicrobiales bacterium]HXZ61412.1 ABC transporter substrate-binding protein [Acidimicrobiales bacterium]